jgi:prolyl oligopeptidase PreP (S9A serine peptidase family)
MHHGGLLWAGAMKSVPELDHQRVTTQGTTLRIENIRAGENWIANYGLENDSPLRGKRRNGAEIALCPFLRR